MSKILNNLLGMYKQAKLNKKAESYKSKVAEMLNDINEPSPIMDYISESEAEEICKEIGIPHEASWYKGDLFGYIDEVPEGMVDVLIEHISEEDAESLWRRIAHDMGMDVDAKKQTKMSKKAQEKESAKKDYTEQYAKVKEIMKEYGYGLSDGGYIYLISKEQPKDEGFQVKFKGDRLRVELDGKLKYSGYGPEAIEDFLKGMFYAKKLSSKKTRKSLHKKAISGFSADVMEINERKLDEIRNTAKDMGDEIWARINENIVKIIAYGYEDGKLKIVYREPYYGKEEVEEMYENADEVSLADFQTLELQKEAKSSHNLAKKADEDLNKEYKLLGNGLPTFDFNKKIIDFLDGINKKFDKFCVKIYGKIVCFNEIKNKKLITDKGEEFDYRDFGTDLLLKIYNKINNSKQSSNSKTLLKKAENFDEAEEFAKKIIEENKYNFTGHTDMAKLENNASSMYFMDSASIKEILDEAKKIVSELDKDKDKKLEDADLYFGMKDRALLAEKVLEEKAKQEKQSSKAKLVRKQAKYEETVQGDEKVKDSAKPFGYDIKFAGHYGKWIYYYLIDEKGNIIRDDKEYQKVYDEMKKRIDDDIDIDNYAFAKGLIEEVDGELMRVPTIVISEYTLLSNHKDREENTGLEEFKRDFNLSSSTKKQAVLQESENGMGYVLPNGQVVYPGDEALLKSEKRANERMLEKDKKELERLEKIIAEYPDINFDKNPDSVKFQIPRLKKGIEYLELFNETIEEILNAFKENKLPRQATKKQAELVDAPKQEFYCKVKIIEDARYTDYGITNDNNKGKMTLSLPIDNAETELYMLNDTMKTTLNGSVTVYIDGADLNDIIKKRKTRFKEYEQAFFDTEEENKALAWLREKIGYLGIHGYIVKNFTIDKDVYIRGVSFDKIPGARIVNYKMDIISDLQKIYDQQYKKVKKFINDKNIEKEPKKEEEFIVVKKDNELVQDGFKTKEDAEKWREEYCKQNGLKESDYYIHTPFEFTSTKKIILNKQATIKHENGVYNVYSESGKCLGKGYKTKEEAEKRLKQVEYFKHKNASVIKKAKNLSEIDGDAEFMSDLEIGNGMPYNSDDYDYFEVYKIHAKNPKDTYNNKYVVVSDDGSILAVREKEEDIIEITYDDMLQELRWRRLSNRKTQPNKRTSLKQVVISKMAKSLKDIPDSVKKNILSDLVYVILTGKGSFAYKTVAKKLETIIKELGYGDKLKANEDGSLPTMEIVELISKEPKVMELAGKFANITRAF